MMLETYLVSILIWMLMIYGTAYLFEEKIRKNGWLDFKRSKKKQWIIVILTSSIPIIRLFAFVSVIIMVSMTEEEFEERLKNG